MKFSIHFIIYYRWIFQFWMNKLIWTILWLRPQEFCIWNERSSDLQGTAHFSADFVCTIWIHLDPIWIHLAHFFNLFILLGHWALSKGWLHLCTECLGSFKKKVMFGYLQVLTTSISTIKQTDVRSRFWGSTTYICLWFWLPEFLIWCTWSSKWESSMWQTQLVGSSRFHWKWGHMEFQFLQYLFRSCFMMLNNVQFQRCQRCWLFAGRAPSPHGASTERHPCG